MSSEPSVKATEKRQAQAAQTIGATCLTDYVAGAILATEYDAWSDAAVEKIKQHLFDTLLAILSGHALPAGRLVAAYLADYGPCEGPSGAVLGRDRHVPCEVAALVNGILAHADETDDTSELARMHPGASIIPAVLALARPAGATGRDVLNAILVGYQVGIAFPQAIWADPAERMHCSRTTHNAGQVMGAVAAAGRLLRLDMAQMRYALSYAAQQASGINSIYRDSHHVEKAYAFGGLPAAQGVQAARLAKLGFTGVADVLDQSVNLFDAYEGRSDPDALRGLIADPDGGVFQADIKLYPVGLPIQAAAQALDELLRADPVAPGEVAEVSCHLPSQKAFIVDDREMPAISLQYILATMIEDGGLSFANSHDQARLDANRGQGLMARVRLMHDDALNPTERTGSRNRARLRVTLKDGSQREATVDHLRGTRFAPATWDDMDRKAQMIFGPGADERLGRLRADISTFEMLDFSGEGVSGFLNRLREIVDAHPGTSP